MFDFRPGPRSDSLKGSSDRPGADAVKELLKEVHSEPAAEGHGAASASEAAPDAQSAASSLRPGARVRLAGLKAKPELNGSLGTLVSFDADKDRWQVRLADGTKLFRAENLELCSEEAPPSQPAREPAEPSALTPGSRVRLRGIKAKPELNGQRGTLVAYDADKGRWQVRLGAESKLFRAENLEPCGAEEPQQGISAASGRSSAQRRRLPTAPLSPEEAVEWVNCAADEFEALLLPLSLEEDLGKIRKQYRQLSLLVHPDKNPHPEAESAFKKLFGAMQKLSDPTEQRLALRRARQRAGGPGGLAEEGDRWWQQATVDEMEKAFREMEQRYEKMGLFEVDRQSFVAAGGVDEDRLWVSPESAKELLDKDLAVFLDSRNTSDFEVSRVQGARSLPGHTMEQLVGIETTGAYRFVVENPELTVVVYSDNGSKLSRCVNVARALRMSPHVLSQRVLRLTGGLNLWKRHGFPVDGDTRALFAGQVLGSSMMRLGGGLP